MGSIGSRQQVVVDVHQTIRGYAPPDPPQLCVDDIRPPIPWYEEERERYEFDWADVDNDIASDQGSMVSPGHAVRGPAHGVKKRAQSRMSALTSKPTVTPSGRPIAFMKQERGRTVNSSIASSSGQVHIQVGAGRAQYAQISFHAVDTHARTTTSAHLQSYTALVDYLQQPIRMHRHRELMIARALIAWLAFQKASKPVIRIRKPNIGTPKGLLQHLGDMSLSYAGAYTILCREAGLQCVIVEGISKPSDYEPGDDSDADTYEDTWTAVHVDGSWQEVYMYMRFTDLRKVMFTDAEGGGEHHFSKIVHPFWICKGLHGHGGTFDDWIQREVENQGQSRGVAVKSLKKLIKVFLNEDYFMPTPEVFVHSCCADDPEWQLLPEEYQLRSREDFHHLPYIFPAFFRLGLKLVSEPTCVLHSENGMCRIWILCEREIAHRLDLTYELFLQKSKYTDTQPLDERIQRLVLHSRHNRLFYFAVRFPIKGTYKLEINGGFHNSHSLRLCQFKLKCEEALPRFKYLPVIPGPLMWGCGPVINEHGLILPSKPAGVIVAQSTTRKLPDSELPTPAASHMKNKPRFPAKKFTFILHPEMTRRVEYIGELYGYHPDTFDDEATPLNAEGSLKKRTDRRQAKRDKKKREEKEGVAQAHNYNHCVTCTRDKHHGTLNISVNLPHEGEFALILKATSFILQRNDITVKTDPVVVCMYLIRAIDDANREGTVHQKLARSELQQTMTTSRADTLRKAIDKCLKMKIDSNDEDISAGEARWEYLTLRKELNDGVHRRNIRIVNERLRKASRYQHKGALLYEIRRLFKVRKQLKLLLRLRQDIPELREASKELVMIAYPPPEVHITMGALCLLLNEPEKYLESWSYVVQQMLTPEGDNSEPALFKKMHLVPEANPTKNTRRKILNLLSEFDLDKVMRTSPAAGKFYAWIQNVMAVLENVEFDLDAIDPVPVGKPPTPATPQERSASVDNQKGSAEHTRFGNTVTPTYA